MRPVVNFVESTLALRYKHTTFALFALFVVGLCACSAASGQGSDANDGGSVPVSADDGSAATRGSANRPATTDSTTSNSRAAAPTTTHPATTAAPTTSPGPVEPDPSVAKLITIDAVGPAFPDDAPGRQATLQLLDRSYDDWARLGSPRGLPVFVMTDAVVGTIDFRRGGDHASNYEPVTQYFYNVNLHDGASSESVAKEVVAQIRGEFDVISEREDPRADPRFPSFAIDLRTSPAQPDLTITVTEDIEDPGNVSVGLSLWHGRNVVATTGADLISDGFAERVNRALETAKVDPARLTRQWVSWEPSVDGGYSPRIGLTAEWPDQDFATVVEHFRQLPDAEMDEGNPNLAVAWFWNLARATGTNKTNIFMIANNDDDPNRPTDATIQIDGAELEPN